MGRSAATAFGDGRGAVRAVRHRPVGDLGQPLPRRPDSVAWHGDRVARHRAETVVAILSLGSPRRFLLRPKGGGRSLRFEPAGGDLLVLGGTCQRTWEHTVPKRAQAGPRISVMFREEY